MKDMTELLVLLPRILEGPDSYIAVIVSRLKQITTLDQTKPRLSACTSFKNHNSLISPSLHFIQSELPENLIFYKPNAVTKHS
jgi:hypothetical protein